MAIDILASLIDDRGLPITIEVIADKAVKITAGNNSIVVSGKDALSAIELACRWIKVH